MKKWVILGMVLVVVLIPAIWAIRYYTAPLRGVVKVQEAVQASAEFRIFSYEHFYDLIAAINAEEAQYDSQWELLQTTEEEAESYSRIQRNLAAIKASIERFKRQYNADAAKEQTRGQFKDSELPFQIKVEPHEYGERTECRYYED